MLIDSGAEISAKSANYEKQIIEDNKRIPTLPINGLNIYNAVGNKTTKVNTQMLLPLSLNSLTIQTPFIVIPSLNEGGIIRNDFLERYKATLDFENQKRITKNGTMCKSIPFTEKKEENQRI